MSKLTRIAVINKDKCKPNKCRFECGLICPVNRTGKECIKLIDIEETAIKKKQAYIVENSCIGCGLCSKEPEHGGCPFGAIMIVNVPSELYSEIINRYGLNGFRLYRMPILKQGKILGIIGSNGIGKSSVSAIITNKMKPNFEKNDSKISDAEILNYFKGTEMYKYMQKLYNNELKVCIKQQHVDQLLTFLKSKNIIMTVEEYINKKNDYDNDDEWYCLVIKNLGLDKIMNYNINTLSGGELQRLVCCATLLTKADVYIFDEPTNFLDVKQRLNIANLINSLNNSNKYIVIIEHDLAILDYVSDYVCIMYGVPSAYGIVSKPLNTSHAINIYFDGYIPSENMRFRENEYNIASLDVCESFGIKFIDDQMKYNSDIVKYDQFELHIEEGYFPIEGSITIIMGANASGKTTLINKLASNLSVSLKPQYLSVEEFKNPNGEYSTVNEFLYNNIKKAMTDEVFKTDVIVPMMINKITDRKLNELSGGELQRFWLVYALGKDSHIYLLDEPSACLDIEQRIIVTKMIKRFIIHNKKVAFVVEHDMMMAVALGNEPNSQCILLEEISNNEKYRIYKAKKPMNFSVGINDFLKNMNITFHTQTHGKHNRPKINKPNSSKDKEQKLKGKYYM